MTYKFTYNDINDLYSQGFKIYRNGSEAFQNTEIVAGDIVKFESHNNTRTVEMIDVEGTMTPSIYFWGKNSHSGPTLFLPWDSSNITNNGFKLEGEYTGKIGTFGPDSLAYTTFEPAVAAYTVDQTTLDDLGAINASMYIDGSTSAAVVGDEIFDGDEVRIEISGGFEFYEGMPQFPSSDVTSTTFWGRDGLGRSEHVGWTGANIIEGGSVIEGTFNMGWDPPTYFYVDARQVTAVLANNRVYLLEDSDMLNDINAERFTLLNPEYGELLDYGTYILSALNLPFDVDSGLIGVEEYVQFADHVTSVKTDTLTVDKILCYVATIEVPEVYGNAIDFQNTEALLYLPYFDAKSIPLEYVIGQTIRVEYLLDAYTGNVDVTVYTPVLDGGAYELFTGSLGVQLPLAKTSQVMLENDQIELGGDNGIRTAFVEIRRNLPAVDGAEFEPVSVVEGSLGSTTGLIQVIHADVRVNATKHEQDELQALLGSGVYMK